MRPLSSTMQETTLYQLIKCKLMSLRSGHGKADAKAEDLDEEGAALMSHEMAVLVGAQNMVRMIRKLHIAMLVLGLASLAVMITSLVNRWYGESKHAKGALQGLTSVFSFVLLIMWLMRAESPTNLLMLLLVMGIAALSMGIVCGLELCD